MSVPQDLISTTSELRRLVKHLKKSSAIGLDAEMDSYYSYYPKLCLIQLSDESHDFLVDPLGDIDLSPLQEIFSDPAYLKIVHAGENDIPYFKEHVGGDFVHLFDTHIAAKVLSLPRSGLAGLLEELLSIHIDKKYQTADWRVRPLPPDQADYAKNDTRHLLALWRILAPQLEEQSLRDVAEFAFRQACQVGPVKKTYDPESWRKVSGAGNLSPQNKAMLRDLYEWRERKAQDADLAVFRIMPEGLLVPLTQHSRSTPAALRQHFHHRAVQQHAEEILQVLRAAPERPVGPRPKVSAEGRLTPSQEKLFAHLRNWRNQNPTVPLANRQLKKLVGAQPANWTSFVALNIMPESLLESLGKELWSEYEAAQPKRQSGRRS